MASNIDGGHDAFNLFISDWEAAPASLPAGVAAWAIGDVHGHLGHLDALLVGVRRAMDDSPAGDRRLVLLGDYVDRGPDNLAVLERAASLQIPGVAVTALRGNHEEFLEEFLIGEHVGRDFVEFWAANGGLATLENLGFSLADIRRRGADGVVGEARSRTPARIRSALSSLEMHVRLGGYLFVHAGVRPDRPLPAVRDKAWTTIREPFLDPSSWVHDFAVVHGHSIVGPDIARHRISVDSGAFWTGVLTAVELRDDQARFIAATREEDVSMLGRISGRRPLSGESWRAYAA